MSSNLESEPELNEAAANLSPIASQLFNRVRSDILADDSPEFLSYESIGPEIGYDVALALR